MPATPANYGIADCSREKRQQIPRAEIRFIPDTVRDRIRCARDGCFGGLRIATSYRWQRQFRERSARPDHDVPDRRRQFGIRNPGLAEFESKRHHQFRYMPAFESDLDRLEVYQGLFRDRSSQPDISEIDIIWPAILADDLVDLSPYLGDDVKAFPPELIQAFTVAGKLVAIPVFVDTGLLYYRSDLLRKYGFRAPPATWEELEKMAKIIQRGERRSGNKDFWGFVWQGQADEGLTCNGLEWQASAGGGHILEPDHTIRVCSPQSVHALERAVSWVGSISPPGIVAYDEEDSLNVWRSGKAAFMRNWLYVYGSVQDPSCPVYGRVGVALLPGGPGGRSRTLGGMGASVSKYSTQRAASIAAIRYLTSMAVQTARAEQIGSVPSRSLLQQRPDIMGKTPFFGPLAGQVMTGVVARPSILAGRSYEAVSRAYFTALERLETQLVQLTGFRPVRN